VGITTGSAAILGDAIHSLADLLNNVMAWVAVRLAAAPPDRDHPYGHRKYEALAVFGLAVLLAVMAFEVAVRGFGRGEREVVGSDWGLGLMLGVLCVNVAITLLESSWARRLDSDILRADVRHTGSDVAITIAVIVGWQLAAAGYAWLDAIFALGIAGLILSLAYGLFRRAIPILVDATTADPERIAQLTDAISGVRDTRRVRSVGSGSNARIEVTVSVDATLTTHASHAIADAIEHALREEFLTEDVTVHIEPDP
jgi:cation diffusion facilitator family transporter